MIPAKLLMDATYLNSCGRVCSTFILTVSCNAMYCRDIRILYAHVCDECDDAICSNTDACMVMQVSV